MANNNLVLSLADSFYARDPLVPTGAFPRTRPGMLDEMPWNKSTLTWLETRLEVSTKFIEELKNRLELMQESDADPELIDSVQDNLQYRLANLENLKAKIELEKKYIAKEAEIELESLKAEIELEIAKEAEIKLENKDIVEAQKHTTKDSKKQQVKRPRQIAKPGKQTTEVSKKQKKVLEA